MKWLLVLVGVVACEKADSAKSERDKKLDFWTEAPEPTKRDGKQKLVYQPENIIGYSVAFDVASDPGADVKMTFEGSMDMGFSGTKRGERDARLVKLSLKMNADGSPMTMEFGNDQFVMDAAGSKTVIKRGEPGMFDVAAIMDTALTTVVFAPDNKVSTVANTKHPFTQIGGDLFDTTLIMFPDLPAGEIAVGHTWTTKRSVAMGNALRVDVGYDFEYLGDGACPSGGTCAVLGFDASSKDVTAKQGAVTLTVSYGFKGRVYFDLAKGRIDESRVKMTMDATADKIKMPMTGTYTIKPS
jgi:hypothetical protein